MKPGTAARTALDRILHPRRYRRARRRVALLAAARAAQHVPPRPWELGGDDDALLDLLRDALRENGGSGDERGGCP